MRKVYFFEILFMLFLVACQSQVAVTATNATLPATESALTPTSAVLTKTAISTPYVQPEFVARIDWADKGVLGDFLSSTEVNAADIDLMGDQKYYADFAVVLGDQKYNFVRFNTWSEGEKVIYAQVKSGKGDLPTWVRMVREVGEMGLGSDLVPSVRWMLGERVVLEYPSEFVCENEAISCYNFYPPYYSPNIGFGREGGFAIYSENIEETIKKVLN